MIYSSYILPKLAWSVYDLLKYWLVMITGSWFFWTAHLANQQVLINVIHHSRSIVERQEWFVCNDSGESFHKNEWIKWSFLKTYPFKNKSNLVMGIMSYFSDLLICLIMVKKLVFNVCDLLEPIKLGSRPTNGLL